MFDLREDVLRSISEPVWEACGENRVHQLQLWRSRPVLWPKRPHEVCAGVRRHASRHVLLLSAEEAPDSNCRRDERLNATIVPDASDRMSRGIGASACDRSERGRAIGGRAGEGTERGEAHHDCRARQVCGSARRAIPLSN